MINKITANVLCPQSNFNLVKLIHNVTYVPVSLSPALCDYPEI